jgi:NIMA (never in mitosis gene a)-related kinase
MSPEVC